MILRPNINVDLIDRVYIDRDSKFLYTSHQFLDFAEVYHKRHTDNEHWKNLILRGCEIAKLKQNDKFKVLDIGSGSGNSVFATLDVLKKSEVYANDISPQLLKILVGISDDFPNLNNRIHPYSFDLHKDFFCDDIFDLIIGGSIIHHLIDPENGLRSAAKSLKINGKIILFEPLEIGAHLMCAVYLHLLDVLYDNCDLKLPGQSKLC